MQGYSTAIESFGDAVQISRQPALPVRLLAKAFIAASLVFLISAPFALMQAGPSGLLAALVASGLSYLLNQVASARRVIEAEPGQISASWWIGQRQLPFDSKCVSVHPAYASLVIKRVSVGRHGHMHALSLTTGEVRDWRFLHLDSRDEAEALRHQLLAVLAINQQG